MATKWSLNPFKKDAKNPDGSPQSEEEQQSALLDAFAAKIDERLDAKLKPINEKVESVAAWQTKIEKEAEAANAPDPNKNPDGTELTDEQKRDQRDRALFAQTVLTNARISENECISRFERQWPQLVDEFRTLCQNTPVDVKARKDYPQLLEKTVQQLVGRDALKNGLRYDANGSRFILEDGVPGDREADAILTGEYDWTDPRNPTKHLTAAQQLRKLNIDPKAFEKWAKETGQVS